MQSRCLRDYSSPPNGEIDQSSMQLVRLARSESNFRPFRYCATAFQLAARVNEIVGRHASNFPAPNEFRGNVEEGPSSRRNVAEREKCSREYSRIVSPLPNIRNSRAESNLDPRSRGPSQRPPRRGALGDIKKIGGASKRTYALHACCMRACIPVITRGEA